MRSELPPDPACKRVRHIWLRVAFYAKDAQGRSVRSHKHTHTRARRHACKHSDKRGIVYWIPLGIFILNFFFFCWESTPNSSHVPQGNGNQCVRVGLCECRFTLVCVCVSVCVVNNSIHLAMVPLEIEDHNSVTDAFGLPRAAYRDHREQLQDNICTNIFPAFSRACERPFL